MMMLQHDFNYDGDLVPKMWLVTCYIPFMFVHLQLIYVISKLTAYFIKTKACSSVNCTLFSFVLYLVLHVLLIPFITEITTR